MNETHIHPHIFFYQSGAHHADSQDPKVPPGQPRDIIFPWHKIKQEIIPNSCLRYFRYIKMYPHTLYKSSSLTLVLLLPNSSWGGWYYISVIRSFHIFQVNTRIFFFQSSFTFSCLQTASHKSTCPQNKMRPAQKTENNISCVAKRERAREKKETHPILIRWPRQPKLSFTV